MRRRMLVGSAVLALLLAAGTVAAQSWDYFARFEVVATPVYHPCGSLGVLGPAQPVVWRDEMWLFHTCLDGQVVAQHFFSGPPLAPRPAPTPVPATITCPADPHPACRVLPAGTYDRAWADTVAR